MTPSHWRNVRLEEHCGAWRIVTYYCRMPLSAVDRRAVGLRPGDMTDGLTYEAALEIGERVENKLRQSGGKDTKKYA